MSVPGCWTRRTGPLLMSARLYRGTGRRTPDRSRPLDPPRPRPRGPRRRPPPWRRRSPRGRRPGTRRCRRPTRPASVGSGTSRSSAALHLQGSAATSAAPAARAEQPRRHRRRREGRGQRPQPLDGRQHHDQRHRRDPRAVVVDDDLDHLGLGGDDELRATRSAGPTPRPGPRAPATSTTGRCHARPPIAGRALAPRHATEVDEPGRDERDPVGAVVGLVHVLDHAVVLAAEPRGGRSPRRPRVRRLPEVDGGHAVGPGQVRAPARIVARSADRRNGTHTSTAASKPGCSGNHTSSTPARAATASRTPAASRAASDRLRLQQGDRAAGRRQVARAEQEQAAGSVYGPHGIAEPLAQPSGVGRRGGRCRRRAG